MPFVRARRRARTVARSPLVVLTAALLLSACGKAQEQKRQASGSGDCSRCHGSADNSAPPRSVRGETATSDIGVGAHQAHLRGGTVRKPLECSECHVVPKRVDDPGHGNGHTELTWGALARGSGAAPVWDRSAGTCATTYCHGTTLRGGSIAAPVWTTVDGSQSRCGTCHGAPPPAPHVGSTRCVKCHPGTVRADGGIDLAGQHVDGQLQYVALTCTTCHGSATSIAPPTSTRDETDTTAISVGAHQAHLTDGPLRRAVQCAECHTLPSDMLHATGTVELTWGPLSTAGGAAPVWSRRSATCGSTYCHGATLARAGGSNTAPVWTRVDGTQAACGTCHGAPPPAPHPPNRNCARCHPDTVRADGSIDVAGGRHINGTVDVGPLGCSMCHGSEANAAPPIGTRDETATTAMAVGAHQAHVTDSAIRRALSCSDCHTVPTTMLHATGTVDLTWGPLATSSGATPTFSFTSGACGSTYCHGATLTRAAGSLTVPVWNRVDGTQAACGTCHGAPPPAPHPPNRNCARCHPDTVRADGSIDVAGGRHINGTLDVGPLGCSSCHGSSANPAPPIGTRDETATTAMAVGAHQAHVTGSPIRAALGCGDCHTVPTTMLHATGTVDLTWGALATSGGASPSFSMTTGTCGSTYCHGATLTRAAGSLTVPVWNRVDGTQAACGTCHGNPPPAPHPANPSCTRCHPDTVRADGSIDVAGGRHINGTLDVGPLGCSSCHGSTANPAPPIGTRDETATTAMAVGAHQAHVTDSPIRAALGCGDCHTVPTTMLHATGTVDLAWGTLATSGGASPSFSLTSGTCGSTYCHGATLTRAAGTLTVPVWNRVDGTQAACGSCHGNPPPAPHPLNPNCNRCHPDTVRADGSIDVAGGRHINGTLDVGPLGCSSCHGSTANAAPPIGTHDETATTAMAVGAHQAHVTDSAIRAALGCGDCHTVPTTMLHATGTVDLTWGALATSGGATPSFSLTSGTCGSTYCHGATLTRAAGTLTVPVWNRVDGTQAACGTCHGAPPPAPHPLNPNCNRCHPDTVRADGSIDVAGGRHINGAVDVGPLGCSSCHGSELNAAPPMGTRGEVLTTSLAVGAHQAHVTDGAIRAALGCGDCHTVPTTMLHATGTVDLTWGPLATSGGATPTFSFESGTCGSTYCHGATLTRAAGTVTVPVWTRVDGTQAACGTCHGEPPPAPHPANPDCNRCHPDTVLASGAIDVAGGRHINGTVDVGPLGCSSCHGSTVNAAPPIGTHGETLTTSLAVGAHQAHVTDSAIRAALGCGDCHAVPTSMLHATGTVDLTWGALATSGGAAPSFSFATGTCGSTYCHGATLARAAGSLTVPVWTRVDGTQAACGTCHGNPPPAPHPLNPNCSRCHPDTVLASGAIDVAGGRHINGAVDVGPLGCSSCHGSDANAAPPIGTRGETATTAMPVGAHQAHVTDSAIRAALGCGDCHTVPTTMLHATGTVDLTWGALATTGGAAPTFSFTSGTCGSTYCHGATLTSAGGTITAPVWNRVDGTQAACGTCHGNPPPAPHPANPDCNRCHPDTVAAGGAIVVAGGKHINGTVDVGPLGCSSCHGSTVNAAPPIGTHGETLTTSLAVGAHQAHVTDSSIRAALTCGDCHTVPTTMLHATGTVDLTWGALATTGGASPTFSFTTGTCGSTYCHGATLASAGGTITAPVWNRVDGTQAACGTCHGNPPPAPHPGNTNCRGCHPDTMLASGAIDVAGGKHINGSVDVGPLGCSSCHGSGLNAAPPIGTHGETLTTSLAVGAHQAHVTDSAIRAALTCGDCHTVPTSYLHATGTVDLTWGALATTGGASPSFSFATGTCASTYCHGATLTSGAGSLTVPVWTRVDGTQAACGTCHGNPPPAPHPANPDCNHCHPDTVAAGGAIDVAGGRHINGTVDVGPLGCSSCHGSSVNAAPPIGTHGETLTTSLSVGAHQAHVTDSSIRKALGCGDCHTVPTTYLHATGTVDLTWGTLATTGGATPSFSFTTGTCGSTYCHGSTLTRAAGTLTVPVWNRVDGTQAACGTCHGNPPPAPHPANPDCNRCHPDTVAAGGAIDVAGGRHINGTVDVGPLGCSSCHGSTVNAAPPIGTHGETLTTSLAVGAHQAHVTDSSIRAALTCGDCHTVPTTYLHATGTVDLTWGALATTGGASPSFSFASGSCGSTYCHGATLKYGAGSLTVPVWTKVDGTQAACGTCHGNPPPAPHPANPDCNHCHPDTVAAGGAIDVAGGRHINGSVDVGPLGCSSCHGSTVNAAPPIGTHGETATTAMAVGAHQAHVTDSSIRAALTCGDCHTVPTTYLHATGTVDLTWGALATTGGASPMFSFTTGACSSTYCHGATMASAGGTITTPLWTQVDGTQAACGTCHGNPPPAPHPGNTNCRGCHPDTVLASGAIDVAGGRHVNGTVDVGPLGCSSCHGSTVNAAPPIGTHGETLTTSLAVGAHQAHVTDSSIRKALGCTDCHTVPTTNLHATGTVDLTWGALATSEGASPTFSFTTGTCNSTYCHGATMASAGGTITAPVWNLVDGTQAACGTCHGDPPPAPHPALTDCNRCHPQTVTTTGAIDVAAGHHIDGVLDLGGLGCSSCHGSDANAAPPIGTHGETATTTLAVGAHQQHVTDTAVRKAMNCTECHPLPTTTIHSNGVVDLVWGPLATNDGATTPSFSATSATCSSTYCHGTTMAGAGGTATTPVWTQVDGSQGTCASCHGDPPPAPHPANPLCNTCHPQTVAFDGTIDVASGFHVNGEVDVGAVGCSSCHGSSTNAAPPIGTRGETATTAMAVGAHQAHVTDGPLRKAMTCTDCHPMPTTTLHADATVQLVWGTLATTGGASPAFSFTTGTCNSTYCHGATLTTGGGTNKVPVWNRVDGTQAACGTCHGAPPPAPHPSNPDCSRCHPQTVKPDGTIDVAGGYHINGNVDVGALGCSSCHGSDANPAPPVGTHGELATTDLVVGAHQAHLTDGPVRKAMACDECHTYPTDLTHIDDVIDLTWGPLATTDGAKPTFSTATATCSSTYCHGATYAQGGGTITVPVWTKVDGTQAACGTCHGDPPPSPHPQNPLCNRCHPQTVAFDGTVDVASGFHIDGSVEFAGVGCSSCHGSEQNAAPPVGTSLETATTTIAVGAHQAHLTDGPLRKAVDCEECHVVPTSETHADGVVELVWGPLTTTDGAVPVWTRASATCASTYCHGATLTSAGGSDKVPVWTKVDGTQAACGTCHGAPPPAPHPTATSCSMCHPKTVKPDGTIDVAGGYHINGVMDASGDCGACHDVPPKNRAHQVHAAFTQSPPIATYGDLRILEDYSPTGGPSYEFGCGNCHPTDAALHMDGKVEVDLAPAGATAGSVKAKNAATAAYDAVSGQCSGVYCHSSGQQLPSYAATPAWTSTAPLGCDGCHGNPPSYPSGGAGAVNANGHIGLTDTGREFGHYLGLAGPAHASKHGGGVLAPGEAAAPITCQSCHYDTTDPAHTGKSGFYYLDTSGRYQVPGGDPQRFQDPAWLSTQCTTCHTGAPGAPQVAGGAVLPLRHVNGRRDVVFDPRTTLPPYTGLPVSPDTPQLPYWVTDASTCDTLPAGTAINGATISFQLTGSTYDPVTKTCASVACHLGATTVWGRGYVIRASSATASCCGCHQVKCPK